MSSLRDRIRYGYHLTAADLREIGACAEQVRQFKAEWPDGVDLTEQSIGRAREMGMDLGWFATNALPAPALAEYVRVSDTAWAEYKRVTAPARAKYERVTAPARAKYERVRALALAEYERVCDAALAEYELVTATARAEYERVTAPALVAALKSIGEADNG